MTREIGEIDGHEDSEAGRAKGLIQYEAVPGNAEMLRKDAKELASRCLLFTVSRGADGDRPAATYKSRGRHSQHHQAQWERRVRGDKISRQRQLADGLPAQPSGRPLSGVRRPAAQRRNKQTRRGPRPARVSIANARPISRAFTATTTGAPGSHGLQTAK